MPRGKRIAITLMKEEQKTLNIWAAAGKTEQRYVQRAKVILYSAAGLPLSEVSRRSGLSRQNCTRWRMRFLEERMDGLYDLPRKGRPSVIPPEVKTKVTMLASTKPPDGSNQWTRQALAKAMGLGKTTVHRILHEGNVKPHNKVEHWYGKSPDPEFEEKQAAILGLYLNPLENALVLCVDQKSQLQTPGNPQHLAGAHRRSGTTCLLAALSVHDGDMAGQCADRTLLGFLKHLYRGNPRKHLYIIMDNVNPYKHKEVTDWANARRRLTIHFTPTHTSWLSQVEIWFDMFTKDVVRGGIWKSKKQMIDQIMHYIRHYTENRAHPFAWTYITGKPQVI